MKQFILKLLSNNSFINAYFSGIGTIFMLHRVYPFEDGKLLPNENMKVSPLFLERFIIEFKSLGYEFISINELYEILKNNRNVKKQIVFTLDDGYKDNYVIAYPIFKKYNIPFTIYLSTSFPEKSAVLWWYVLEELIIKNHEIYLSNGNRYICKTSQDKIKTFLQIRETIMSFPQPNIQEKMTILFSKYDINWSKCCDELTLNWEEIQELSKDNLVTIAGHTKNHYMFKRLEENEIFLEIVEANNLIESKINKKIEHFSYPFGTRDEIGIREFEILKKMNFKTATTTRNGNIFLQHKEHLEALPRIMLTENLGLSDIGKIRKKRIIVL